MSTTPASFTPNPVAFGSENPSVALRGRGLSTKPWLGLSGQWGAIAGGALSGLAVGIAMATLGAALGMTASAVMADQSGASITSEDGMQATAMGFSIGAGIWLLLTAAVVGLTGGGVLAKMAHPDRPYAPKVLGLVTWSLGIAVAGMLAASGASGVATGVGVGGAGAVGAVANSPGMMSSMVGAASSESSATMSAEQRTAALEAAETAAQAASTAAWFALVALMIGLGTTLLMASRRKAQAESDFAVAQA